MVNQKTGLKSSLTKLQQKEKWESSPTVIITQTIYTSQSFLSSASLSFGRKLDPPTRPRTSSEAQLRWGGSSFLLLDGLWASRPNRSALLSVPECIAAKWLPPDGAALA